MRREIRGVGPGDGEGVHRWLLSSPQRALRPLGKCRCGPGRGVRTAEGTAGSARRFVWDEGLVRDLDGDPCPREVSAQVGQSLWVFEAKPAESGIKPRSPGSQVPAFPGGCQQGRGRPGVFRRLWAGEGLSGIKKHQFFLRFCCLPHRKRTFLDFKRMTSFFFLFT